MSSRSDFISKRRRRAIYTRDAFRCVWCLGYPAPDALTLDHVVPRAHGGNDSTRNLVTACLRCNSARGSKTLLCFAREMGKQNPPYGSHWIVIRVLCQLEIPVLHRPTKRDARRQRGQLSMVLQEGELR